MLREGGGAVVNTASLAGLIGFPMHVAYCTSKHAVIGITRTAALEYAKAGIRVKAVCPAFIQTPMLDSLVAASGVHVRLKRMAAMHPMRRTGTPEVMDANEWWLCSGSTASIT